MWKFLFVFVVFVTNSILGSAHGQGAGVELGLGPVTGSLIGRIGYQQTAMNINLPIPDSGDGGAVLASESTVDFRLLDSGVWIGGLAVRAAMDSVSIFAGAEVSVPRSIRVATASDPFFTSVFQGSHVEWSGSKFEWYSLEGGAAVAMAPELSLVGGLRTDNSTVKLGNPRDSTGELQSFQALFGDRYSGDLLARFWIPYVGIEIGTRNSLGRLLFSPYAWADVKIPFRYTFVNVPGSDYLFEQARYTFKNGGLFLEGSFDYSAELFSNLNFALWLKANWLRIRGRGNESWNFTQWLGGVPSLLDNSNSSATGTVTSYNLAGGFYGVYSF